MNAAAVSLASPRSAWLLWIGLVLLAASSLFVGVGRLSPSTLWNDANAWNLLLTSRLPRTLAVLLTGGGLAIGGLVMQTLARNRFVEPATAGTAQGAALGILIITLLAPEASLLVKSLGASGAALAATSVFVAFAHRLPPTQPFLVPLFGLIYGGILGAAVTYSAWNFDLLQYVDIWLNGEFSGVLQGRYEVLWLAALCMFAAWWVADRLTILSLGRDASVGLGIDYQRMLQLGLVIVSVVTAVTVVVVGTVPFVGLVVPALVARFSGDNLRLTIPQVAGVGAGLVLICDLICRIARFPYEIPVGTVLGVVGAVLFLVLLYRRAGHA